MRWISIDAAGTVSGYTLWEDDKILSSGNLRRRGGKGSWYYGEIIVDSELAAWRWALSECEVVIAELARGKFRTADKALFSRLGYIRALADIQGAKYQELSLTEWRRMIKEMWGCPWPKGSDRCKALAIALVNKHLGMSLDPKEKRDEDRAESALMGYAALKSGLVEIK